MTHNDGSGGLITALVILALVLVFAARNYHDEPPGTVRGPRPVVCLRGALASVCR